MCEWNDLRLRLTENQSNYTSSPFMKNTRCQIARIQLQGIIQTLQNR